MVQETVEFVEETYLVPMIGEDFYLELVDAYAQATPPTNELAAIRKLQPALAWFTFFEMLGNAGIQVGNQGPGQSISQDGSYLPPAQWRTKEGQRNAYRRANQRLNVALDWLFDRRATYATFAASQAHLDDARSFFPRPLDLARQIPMNAASVLWLQLRPVIDEAEERYIRPVLGDALFQEIKTALQGGPISAEQTKLVSQVRTALGHFVRKCAVPNLSIRFAEGGVLEPYFDQGPNGTKDAAISPETAQALWVEDKRAGEYFLNSLQSWLWENANLFPTYQASPQYEQDTPPTAWQEDQDQDTGVGSLL